VSGFFEHIKNSIYNSKIWTIFGNITINIGDKNISEQEATELFNNNISKELDESNHNMININGDKNIALQNINGSPINIDINYEQQLNDLKNVLIPEIRSSIKEEMQLQNLSNELDLLNEYFGTDIDAIKEDIDNNNVDSALNRLLKLKDSHWKTANSEIKFRILTNIGVAYLKSEKPIEASESFIEAYNVLPDNPKALNNVGVAFILQNKIEPAIFNEIKQKSPELFTSLDIRFNRKEQTIDEIELGLTPAQLKDENILMSLANHAHFKRQPDKAISYCKIALELNKSSIHQENLANSIFTKFINYPQLTFKYSNKTDDKEQIKVAIELFESCWDNYKKGETKKYKADIKAKQAILFSLIGKTDDAENAIEIALKENNTDEYFLKYKSQILTSNGKFKDAIKILKELDFGTHPDACISLSICYLHLNDIDNSIGNLEEFIAKNKNTQFQENAIGLLLDIYITNNKLSDAEKLINGKSEIINNTNELLVDKSRYFFKKGETEKATKIIEQVISVSNNENQQINYLIAQTYEEQGLIEKAIEFYVKNVDLREYNDITNKIANLYLKINKNNEALKLYISFREYNGIIKNITKNEIILHIHKGDLPKAKEIADLYLSKFPDDDELKINLLVTNTRLGFQSEVDELLKQSIDYSVLPLNLIQTYLVLLAENGLKRKAYEILYELWNVKNNSLFNDLLIRFNMSYSLSQEIAEHSELAKENYAIYVKDENNFNWYIITNKEDKDLYPNEINNKSQYYHLLNKKIGEEVTINSEPLNEKVQIVEIKHKFEYIIKTAFEKVGKDFKGKSQFRMFSTDRFYEIIEQETIKQKEKEEIEKEYLQKYNDKQIPINFFSKLFNVSPIRIWYNFTSFNITFHCVIGLPDELDNSIKIFENKKDIFVDIYTLLTIYNLPSKDIIVTSLKLKTSQITFDIVENFIAELSSGVDYNSMRLFIKDNVKYKIDEPIQTKHDALKFFKSFLSWIITNISIKSSDLFLQKNHEHEDVIRDVFGKSTYYTVLLAKENNGIAYIDDFCSRDFLCREFAIQGVWTQSVINYLVKSEIIVDTQIDIIRLAQFNYRHTSINVNTLHESFKLAGYKNKPPFTKVTSILKGNISSNFAVVIGITFLFDVLKNNNLEPIEKKNIVLHIISELLLYRTLIDVYELIYMLLLKELINSPNEVDFIFARLREYLSFSKLDKVIEEHPAKFGYLRFLALQVLRIREEMKNKK